MNSFLIGFQKYSNIRHKNNSRVNQHVIVTFDWPWQLALTLLHKYTENLNLPWMLLTSSHFMNLSPVLSFSGTDTRLSWSAWTPGCAPAMTRVDLTRAMLLLQEDLRHTLRHSLMRHSLTRLCKPAHCSPLWQVLGTGECVYPLSRGVTRTETNARSRCYESVRSGARHDENSSPCTIDVQ